MPASLIAASISGQTSRCAATYSSMRSGFTSSSKPTRSATFVLLFDDEHEETPRAVHALDSPELDVRRGARAGYERQRARCARREAIERLGHRLHDLRPAYDADVEIGDERQRASAFLRAAGEHDRSRRGDGDGARRDDAVQAVEVAE